jgi:hypothetical protein
VLLGPADSDLFIFGHPMADPSGHG